MPDLNSFLLLYAGGKTSGIFGEVEPPAQPQKNMPPGGQTSNIFGGPENAPVQSPSRSHPNKPKVLQWFPVSLPHILSVCCVDRSVVQMGCLQDLLVLTVNTVVKQVHRRIS